MHIIKKYLSLLFIFLFCKCIFSSESIKKDFEIDREKISNFMITRKIDVNNSPVNILSIDGGGVRGIIPAVFLQRLQTRLDEHFGVEKNNRVHSVRDLFDMTVGTSTGAILSLGLTTERSQPVRSFRGIEDMVELYRTLSAEIFPPTNPWLKPLYFLPSNFWWGSEYSEEPLENRLKTELEDMQLQYLTIPSVVTSVNANDNSLKLFRSYRAIWRPEENFLVRDIVRSTTAAPTYFPMKKISPIGNNNKVFSLVDGGMAANNPSLIALAEAYNLFGSNRINLISLGTGNSVGSFNFEPKEVAYVRRANPTIQMLFSAQSSTTHQTISNLSQAAKQINYQRVQVTLPDNLMAMDCASNIESLINFSDTAFQVERKVDDVFGILMTTLREREFIFEDR